MKEEGKAKTEREFCPYCDEEIAQASFPYCQACKVTMMRCPRCHKFVSRKEERCPSCGAKIREELKRGID